MLNNIYNSHSRRLWSLYSRIREKILLPITIRRKIIKYVFNDETINILKYSCPICDASDRDRLYALYFKNKFDVIDKSKRYKFIDFAPTYTLSKFIKSYSFLEYRSADLFSEHVDDQVDITDMKIYETHL